VTHTQYCRAKLRLSIALRGQQTILCKKKFIKEFHDQVECAAIASQKLCKTMQEKICKKRIIVVKEILQLSLFLI